MYESTLKSANGKLEKIKHDKSYAAKVCVKDVIF